MSKLKNNDFYVGRKIMAYEEIRRFSDNKFITNRGRGIGVIEKIENGLVYIYDKTNPINYQNYTIEFDKFKKYIENGLYKTVKVSK